MDLKKAVTLENHGTWKLTNKKHRQKAIRETDTLDTFVDSSCILRFCSPKERVSLLMLKNKLLMPVDQYIGGIEHAILLTILKIFYASFKKNNKNINDNEPFRGLFTQGMVCHETYKDQMENGLIQLKLKKPKGEL